MFFFFLLSYFVTWLLSVLKMHQCLLFSFRFLKSWVKTFHSFQNPHFTNCKIEVICRSIQNYFLYLLKQKKNIMSQRKSYCTAGISLVSNFINSIKCENTMCWGQSVTNVTVGFQAKISKPILLMRYRTVKQVDILWTFW